MLTSLGLIFLLGLLMAAVCQRIHLPRIIGMLITGIILGPYVLDLLDVSILNISSELRQIALIIILLKAGLSLDLKDLKKVGRSAVMLACVPATCELLAFVIFAPMILNISRVMQRSWEQFWQPCHLRLWCRGWYILWKVAMVRRKAFRR